MDADRLLAQLRAVVERRDTVDPAIFAANCRTDAGAELETPADVITHLASTEGSIVHAEVGSTSATLVVDAVDYVTGLSVREAWTFVMSGGVISRIIGCCGGRLIQERQKLAHREVDAYLRGYDLHFVTAAEEPVVALARDALSTWLGRPVSSDTRDALVNEDLIYIPETWVGCGGFLYDRRAERIILLGSGIPVAVHVWAFYRGFADGETGADRLNDLFPKARLRSFASARRSPPSRQICRRSRDRLFRP